MLCNLINKGVVIDDVDNTDDDIGLTWALNDLVESRGDVRVEFNNIYDKIYYHHDKDKPDPKIVKALQSFKLNADDLQIVSDLLDGKVESLPSPEQESLKTLTRLADKGATFLVELNKDEKSKDGTLLRWSQDVGKLKNNNIGKVAALMTLKEKHMPPIEENVSEDKTLDIFASGCHYLVAGTSDLYYIEDDAGVRTARFVK